MNIDISLLPTDTIKLLLTKHAVDRFTERFNVPCDIENLNSVLHSGYFLNYSEKRVYFYPYNVLVSVDNKNLPDRTFAVKTFIPRNGTFVNCDNSIKVKIEWGMLQ